MKPFTTLAIVFLSLIAIGQLTRFVLGWEVNVNGVSIPVWASALAFVVAGGIAALLWRESGTPPKGLIVVQPTYFAVRRVHGRAWDAALPMRSQSLWPEHAEFMNTLTVERFVILGGLLGSRAETLLVIDAPTEEAVRARLAKDPWSMAHILEIASIEPWTIMLDGRRH